MAARGTAALPGTEKKAGTGSSQSPSSSSSFSRSPSPRRTRFFPHLGRSLLAKASRPLKDAEGHDPRRWGASSRGAAGRARLSADAVMGANAPRPRRGRTSLPRLGGGFPRGRRGKTGKTGEGEARASPHRPKPRAARSLLRPPARPRAHLGSCRPSRCWRCVRARRLRGLRSPRGKVVGIFFRTWEHARTRDCRRADSLALCV